MIAVTSVSIFALKVFESLTKVRSALSFPSRKTALRLFCWGTGIRTPIKGFKGLCPTIRRFPNLISHPLFAFNLELSHFVPKHE